MARHRLQMRPAGLESTGGIVSQSRERPVLVRRNEQAGFEQYLEAVADADDQLLGVAKLAEGVAEKGGQFNGQDLAGGNIVAVGEPAGDRQDVEFAEQLRVLAEAPDVNALGPSTGALESELRLLVAVRAGARRIKAVGVAMRDGENRGKGLTAAGLPAQWR